MGGYSGVTLLSHFLGGGSGLTTSSGLKGLVCADNGALLDKFVHFEHLTSVSNETRHIYI